MRVKASAETSSPNQGSIQYISKVYQPHSAN